MYSIDLFAVIIADTLPGNTTVVALETLPFRIERACFLKTLQSSTINPILELATIIEEPMDVVRGNLAKSVARVIPFLKGIRLGCFDSAVSNGC